MPRLVVFDFDGTLVDSLTDLALALNRARAELGLSPESPEVIRTWVGEGVDALVSRALPEALRTPAAHAELLRRYRGYYREMMLDHARVYPGVRECLQALEDEVLAVCSNKPTEPLEEMLVALGLRNAFAVVVGGDTLPVKKPDPAVLRHIVARAGVVPSVSWMVGDSAVDIQTGQAAGARTLGCTYGLRGRDELVRAGAEHLVDDAAAIAPTILGVSL